MPLREVLTAFEQAGPLSLAQLAQRLNADESALDGMIQFWVKKGKLRETDSQGCAACYIRRGCPVLTNMPRRYELVTKGEEPVNADPPCHPTRQI